MNLKRRFAADRFLRDCALERHQSNSRWIIILGLIVAVVFALSAGVAQAKTPTQWVAGELLVGYRAGAVPSKVEAIYRSLGITVVEDIGAIRVVRVRTLVPLMDVTALLLSRLPEVKFVEKNYIFDPAVVPDDPQYVDQWHLPKIQAPQAWDITQGSPGVVIAIIDSGVDPTHPDLAGNLVPGYNTYYNTTDTADLTGHGTEVAGAAAARTGNGQGIASIAGLSPIMPIRVSGNPPGHGATSLTIASGLIWAADHGARVMNLSFEGIAGNATIRAAAEYAYNKGALVVAAAGNCGCVDPTAENPFVLSVSATDENDGLAYFSSTGPYVNIAAPGNNIWTTAIGGLYFAESGTSLASPIVAGVAALMRSVNGALTPSSLTQLLGATAVDLGAPGNDPSFGYGRVNAFAAVTAAASYVQPPDTTAPSASLTAPSAGATVSGTVVVTVSTFDDVGVVKVDFYVDGALAATDTSTPFSYAWDTTLLANGSHTIQAIASDAAGNTGSTVLTTVTILNDIVAPSVAISSPASGATVSGTITVTATASDNVGVAKVDFYVDGVLKATDTSTPYSFSWNTTTLSNATHTLQAVAADAAGNTASTSVMSVTVFNDTIAPTVAMGSPASAATVSGTITVSATASDNVAVARVEFYVDGVLSATDTSSPYSFSLNTTTLSNGTHTLQAIAADAAGNSASTPLRSVTVFNDSTAPTVAMSAPAAGATLSGTTTVTATASDNVAVVKVEFYIDGVLRSTDTSAPYAFAWDTTASGNGSHTLRATATDAAGNSASATNTVTVANVTNQAPVAVNDSVTAPYRPSTSYTPRVFAVLANDSDADGSLNVTSVKIVKSPNKNGTVTVNSNGTVSYSPERGYRGTETFTYNVKDNLGLVSNTATVTVTVQ